MLILPPQMIAVDLVDRGFLVPNDDDLLSEPVQMAFQRLPQRFDVLGKWKGEYVRLEDRDSE